MSGGLAAARVGDPIAHSNAASGMLIGALIGLAAGAVLVGATIATGGAALAVVAAVGGAAGLTSFGGLSGMNIGGASMGPPTGALVVGSSNVKINGCFATMTARGMATCSNHSGSIPLATGAATVKINGLFAGRIGEKLGCSALVVATCSPDVMIGGPSAADPNVKVTPEVPEWAVTALQVLGIAGAVMALPYALATLGVAATIGGAVGGYFGGEYGGVGGRKLGEAMGMSETGIRSMEAAGQFLGGMAGGAAGVKGAQVGEAALGVRPLGVSPSTAVPKGVPLSKAEFDRIRALPREQRPADPRSYLGDRYVDNHLQKFDQGGSYLTPTSVLDRFGRASLGRADGQFIMPKAEMDALVARTGGDIGRIETELGIPKGTWDKPGSTLSRIDIGAPNSQGLRMPSGREAGANDLWMPGGYLPSRAAEAVVNPIPAGSFTETIIGGKK